MKNKKMLAVLLSLSMIVGSFPAMVFAEEVPFGEQTEVSEEVEEENTASYYAEPNSGDAELIFGELDSQGRYVLPDGANITLEDDITTYGRIYVDTGRTVTINLNGHTINRGLTEASEGGGVFGVEDKGTLTVTNGTVTGGYRGSGNGGAFNVAGTLILENVEITGNRAEHAGGGIYISGTGASATLEGNCNVTGNTAGTYGDGIYVGNGGSIKIKGKPVIKNNGSTNVYLAGGCIIEVTGALSSGSHVGVTYEDEGKGPFTSGFGDDNTQPDKYFFADNDNAGRKIISDGGEAWIGYGYISRSWDDEAGKVVDTEQEVHKYISFTKVGETSFIPEDQTVDLINNQWYVVDSTVELEHLVRCFIGANILLCDGYTLTCDKGILVENNNTLNIYGQNNDSGTLVVTGESDSAGIGGTGENTVGHINIYGGTINATGGSDAAGIGSGNCSLNIGSITVLGGVVKATGGESGGAGIGSGSTATNTHFNSTIESGSIEIRGGSVEAYGNIHSAGIGGGESANIGSNVSITISGGSVKATVLYPNTGYYGDGDGGAGIGAGGYYANQGGDFSGNLTISGGNVYALGGTGAAGIGCGYFGRLYGNITISGGEVSAYANNGGAAIGSGYRRKSGGNVVISGGKIVLASGGTICYFSQYIGRGDAADTVDDDILTLSGDLCVFFTNNTDKVLVPGTDRVSACRSEFENNKVLTITLCDHEETTYTCDEAQHTMHCSYCETVFAAESHTIENGVCTVCGYDASSEFGEKVAGYKISLQGDIGVNFYMTLPEDLALSKTAYLQFTLPDGGTSKIMIKDVDPWFDGDTLYYIFNCHVAAKDMTKPVTAQIIDGDRSGTIYSFTVKDYAEYLLAHPEVPEFAKAAPLVKALLNYGTAAQVYFNVGGEAANADMSSADQNISGTTIPEPSASVVTLNQEGVAFAGATLSIKSETTLSLYFTGLSSDTVFTCAGKTVETDTSGSYTIARIRGINARELGESFTVTFGDNNSVTYSPMNYCYKALNGGTTDTNLQNVCRALYCYKIAADEYFA